MVQFRVPYPPSLNKMYRKRKGFGMYLTPEAKAFKEQVFWLAKAAGATQPMTGWIEVVLTLHPVEPRDAAKRAHKLGATWHLDVKTQDTDNQLKAVLDAMQGAVYVDDKQIVVLLVQRGLPIPDGGIDVRILKSTWEDAA